MEWNAALMSSRLVTYFPSTIKIASGSYNEISASTSRRLNANKTPESCKALPESVLLLEKQNLFSGFDKDESKAKD
jgi:hypothetical protein